ncbi:MAG: hypothetical protein JWN44_1863 [Myxococcales bacterium]|nr:hypothetical protein [Myxococcales bacterium]
MRGNRVGTGGRAPTGELELGFLRRLRSRTAAESVARFLVRDRWTKLRLAPERSTGVPRAGREALFQPFVARRPGGSGLGLPVARSVARQHGGTVRFVDGPGGSVRFAFPHAGVRASARQ